MECAVARVAVAMFIALILARGAIARLFLAFITRDARVRATRMATYRSLDLRLVRLSHFFFSLSLFAPSRAIEICFQLLRSHRHVSKSFNLKAHL